MTSSNRGASPLGLPDTRARAPLPAFALASDSAAGCRRAPFPPPLKLRRTRRSAFGAKAGAWLARSRSLAPLRRAVHEIASTLLFLAALPGLFWSQAVETRTTVRFSTSALSDAELGSREALPSPGVAARAGLASPTRSPWIVANGWRFTRSPGGKYRYDLPAGKAALAAAEAFAYGADALLKIDPADAVSLGAMLTALGALPAAELPPIADLGVIDDGSSITGEVMNLLARRNLLYQAVQSPSTRFRVNIAMGSREYPVADAADPSALALKIRHQLTDEQRSLRIYGSEVVIGRLTGDAGRIRLHLINYGGREIEGLRVRVRGGYGTGDAYVEGVGRVPLQDHVATDGATEFSLPRIGAYAMIDLTAAR